MRNENQKTSTILNLVILVIAVDAVVVFGAAMSYQFLQMNYSWLLMVSLVSLALAGLKRKLGERMTLALGDLAAISSAVLFDPSVAVIMAAINHIVCSGNLKNGYRKPIFNVSSAAVSMNAGVYAVRTFLPSFGDKTVTMSATETILALAVSTTIFFAFSIALLAVYEALGNKASLFAEVKRSLPANFKSGDGRQHRKLRLGEILIARGLITAQDLNIALDMQKRAIQPSKRVGEILVEMGLIEERQVMAALTDGFAPAFSSI